MSTHESRVRSRHFRVEQLTDGVYAAIHEDGGWASGNAGIVDLGNRTLVFDTGLTPQAAYDLHTVAETLTGQTPNFVINSHYHKDHIRGNQVFSEAIVVSTWHTKELIATKGKAELEADRKQASEQVTAMKALAKSTDTEKQKMASLFLPYWQGVLASLPQLRLRLPELTFWDQITFYGRERTVRLINAGHSHTEGDCILFLPQEKIMFCGDLLFVRCHARAG